MANYDTLNCIMMHMCLLHTHRGLLSMFSEHCSFDTQLRYSMASYGTDTICWNYYFELQLETTEREIALKVYLSAIMLGLNAITVDCTVYSVQGYNPVLIISA